MDQISEELDIEHLYRTETRFFMQLFTVISFYAFVICLFVQICPCNELIVLFAFVSTFSVHLVSKFSKEHA